jgi:hypothetical protein
MVLHTPAFGVIRGRTECGSVSGAAINGLVSFKV